MRAKQEVLQCDQYPGQERDDQDGLRPHLEGNKEHESEERDRGYQHEESREPAAKAEEKVGAEGIEGLNLVYEKRSVLTGMMKMREWEQTLNLAAVAPL